MVEFNSMKILETCKVIPADSPSKFSLPLTFLDRIWLETDPTSRLFFYEVPELTTELSQTILPKLKHSLSLTLQHFLPLSGNLTWPQDSILPVIQYSATDGDGVALTVAETSADFDYLSGNNFRESADLHSLLPVFSSSETLSPIMTIQITLFPNRGFSMAYVAHHASMDGKSTSMFLHLWAYICKNGHGSVLPPELIPSIDRTCVEQQKALEQVYPKGFGLVDLESKTLKVFDMSPPDTVLGTFKLTRENLETLRNKAKTSARLSTFTITSAYVGSCLIRATKITADFTYLGFSVDCRLRLDPPLPLTYFGNCLLGYGAGRDTKEYLAEDGFVTAVSCFTAALANLNEGILKAIEKINTARSAAALASKPKSYAGISTAGSPRFELYKVDFGLGKLRKAEMISIAKGHIIYLSDDRDANGGIEIGVALKKHETEAFAYLFSDGVLGC